jgi:MFS transporter, DHA2 family, methylenomycin A resistance protein
LPEPLLTIEASVVGIGAFVVFCAAFVVVELRAEHPALPLGLLRSPAVAVCTATGFALNFAFYGIVFVLTLFFQDYRGACPLLAGLMFLPMTALVMAMNLLAGRLTNRYGPRAPMIAGQVMQAAGLLGLLAVDAQSSTTLILLLLIPLGIGGLAVPPMTAALLEAVDAQRSGVASGVLIAARQLGGAIGVALFGAFAASQADFITGMHASLIAGGAALLLTATAGAVFLRLPRSPRV